NSSSPSPVTDGKHAWVVTGTGAVTAFDMLGNKIWQRNLQREYGRFGLNWGYASSPLLYRGKLIIQVLHATNTTAPSYIAAAGAAAARRRPAGYRRHSRRLEVGGDGRCWRPDARLRREVLLHGRGQREGHLPRCQDRQADLGTGAHRAGHRQRIPASGGWQAVHHQ